MLMYSKLLHTTYESVFASEFLRSIHSEKKNGKRDLQAL